MAPLPLPPPRNPYEEFLAGPMSPEQNKLVVNLRCVILKKKIKERNFKKKANLGKVRKRKEFGW